jgi:hypothetical protein
MGQRGIRADQIDYVMRFGKVYDRAGATWYVLRRKDVPTDDLAIAHVQKSIGIIVCVVDSRIATAYHRDRPSHYIRCKAKRSLENRTCNVAMAA